MNSPNAALLFIILATVHETAHDEPGENLVSDREASNALEQLYRNTIDKDHHGGHDDNSNIGLLPYIGRLIECEADPVR